MTSTAVTAVCVWLLVMGAHMLCVRADGELREYCEGDTFFNAVCNDSEVVLIKHARYGRMREGKCISSGSGFLGCAMDARGVLASECSGRHSCKVVINNIPPTDNPPCRRDLRGYLEVAFECISVVSPPNGYCQPGQIIETRDQRGYLSSIVAEKTECGVPASPWSVRAKPGQKIRFQLLDFSAQVTDQMEEVRECATIDEAQHTDTVVLTKNNSLYTSRANQVDVTLHVGAQASAYFLLKFEVIGCPDQTAPENGWVKRSGDDILIGCDHDPERTWQLRCNGSAWAGDAAQHQCPIGETVRPEQVTKPNGDVHKGQSGLDDFSVFLITLGVGVVDVVGLCLLVCGMVYICRRWKYRTRMPSIPAEEGLVGGESTRGTERPLEMDYRTPPPRRDYSKDYPTPPPRRDYSKDYRTPPPQRDYSKDYRTPPPRRDYSKTWQAGYQPEALTSLTNSPSLPKIHQSPAPTCRAAAAARAGYTRPWNGTFVDHVYEHPDFVMPPRGAQDGEDDSTTVQYYELDPDYIAASRENTLESKP